jgi:hypothetical protein
VEPVRCRAQKCPILVGLGDWILYCFGGVFCLGVMWRLIFRGLCWGLSNGYPGSLFVLFWWSLGLGGYLLENEFNAYGSLC